MADEIIVKVMRNGEPVENADVTVMVGGTGSGKGKADKEGKAIALKKAGDPVLAHITVKGEGFAMGGGPYEVTPGEEFILEV